MADNQGVMNTGGPEWRRWCCMYEGATRHDRRRMERHERRERLQSEWDGDIGLLEYLDEHGVLAEAEGIWDKLDRGEDLGPAASVDEVIAALDRLNDG